MGWMHDFCEYMKLDPIYRKGNHYAMTFAMSYNESEKYILPLSHDEVVHLKCSMVNKMPGYQARITAPHHGIQVFEKLDGFQVLMSAILVRQPLALSNGAIQSGWKNAIKKI